MVRNTATAIETKGVGKKLIFDPDTLAFARGVLRGTGEYHFSLWTSGSCAITTNVVAGSMAFDPTGATEWSSFQALFDEYRVDEAMVLFSPVVVAGNTGMNWAQGGLAVGNDYNSSGTPGSEQAVLNLAESQFFPLSSVYTVGSTSTNATSQLSAQCVHWAKMPRTVELASAATVASAEWIALATAWPGGVLFYGVCNGTNNDTPLFKRARLFIRLRQRA
jgi:hypothetical protein